MKSEPYPVRAPLPLGTAVRRPDVVGLARLVRALVLLGAASLLVLPAVFWLSPDWVAEAAPQMAGLQGQAVTVDGRARALGALASLPMAAAAVWMLWCLWRLFGEYAGGRVFAPAALQHLGGFAHALLATALLTPLLRTGIGLALTLGNPPGQHMLLISLSWHDYLALLLGAVLLAITRVMRMAVALAEENDGFV